MSPARHFVPGAHRHAAPAGIVVTALSTCVGSFSFDGGSLDGHRNPSDRFPKTALSSIHFPPPPHPHPHTSPTWIQIYASFKGVPSGEVAAAAQHMLAEVGLTEKAHSRSSTLSGGQKRKLSLGIALIGDSKVVILDGEL